MRRMCIRILFVALALTPGIAAGQGLDIFNPNEPFVTGPPPGATAPATSVTDGPRVVLYDNGPLVTHPAGGGGGADASAVQSALSMSLYGFGWQNNLGNRMADDFVVTDPAGWQIDTITFFGYQTGSTTTSTFTGVFVQIWDGPPNAGGTVVWGDQTTNRLLTTGWSNIYRVLDTNLPDTNRPIMEVVASVGITLAPGTYWLDFSATGSLTSGPWAPPISILGTTATGNALQYTTTSGVWGPANDTGSGSQQGMPFIINGDVVGPPPGTGDPFRVELYRIQLFPDPAGRDVDTYVPGKTKTCLVLCAAVHTGIGFGRYGRLSDRKDGLRLDRALANGIALLRDVHKCRAGL